MAWLAGWSYRKAITITGQSGAGTSYQVDLDIGDSAGGDFHLEGHCTNFPQDIEVTDNDGTTLLDFFIEDLTADPLKMWVEVADDLGSNQAIYIYYGKSGASTDSDGDATFLQYHGSASSNFLDSVAAPYTEIGVHIKWTRGATTNTWWGLGTVLSDAGGDQLVFKTTTTHEGWYYWKRNDGGTWDGEYGSPGWDTNPHISRINYISDVATLYVDDVHKGTSLSNDSYKPDQNMGLGMFIAAGTASQDWSFVRKLIATEPAFSSAGSEETPPVTGHPWFYERKQ